MQLCTCIFTGILLLGNCYQVQCTTGVTVTDTNYLQSVVLPGGSSSNLIYNDLYLIVCLRMLLLLSGDVELNPGPITGKHTLNITLIKCIDFRTNLNSDAYFIKTMLCIRMKLQSIIVIVVLCLREENCSSSKNTSKVISSQTSV